MTLNTGKTVILTLDNLFMYCHEEGDCLIWKLATNGAGTPVARIDGKPWVVGRYVYSVLMGKELRAGRLVSTKCRNSLCLSPHCLVARSRSELSKQGAKKFGGAAEYINRRNAYVLQGKNKLTMDIARNVRASREITSREWAEKLGVNISTIKNIRAGQSWRETITPRKEAFNFMREAA